MVRLQWWRQRPAFIAAAAAVALSLVVIGGARYASSAPAPTSTAACWNKFTGLVRVLKPNQACVPLYENPIDLGAGSGASGPVGPTGPTGATRP
ncbi:MAG TPA: hypothetical protein PLX85_08805, partial [Dehalococcoidia bacterium]|nr:hypothetical protein [Dehalococcoidia bacterium]